MAVQPPPASQSAGLAVMLHARPLSQVWQSAMPMAPRGWWAPTEAGRLLRGMFPARYLRRSCGSFQMGGVPLVLSRILTALASTY